MCMNVAINAAANVLQSIMGVEVTKNVFFFNFIPDRFVAAKQQESARPHEHTHIHTNTHACTPIFVRTLTVIKYHPASNPNPPDP